MFDREALAALIREKALQFGKFTLASGKQASYYLDCRKVALDARGARLIAEGILQTIEDDMPDCVGGMVVGAVPITGAILALAGERGLPLTGIMVRKEPKGHGTGNYVEGSYRSGQRVVIVEDVVTTARSALDAAQRCEEVGLKIDRVVAVVDRLEGGREACHERGLRLETLFTVRELGVATS